MKGAAEAGQIVADLQHSASAGNSHSKVVCQKGLVVSSKQLCMTELTAKAPSPKSTASQNRTARLKQGRAGRAGPAGQGRAEQTGVARAGQDNKQSFS